MPSPIDLIVTLDDTARSLPGITRARDALRAAGMWVESVDPIERVAYGTASAEALDLIRGARGVASVVTATVEE